MKVLKFGGTSVGSAQRIKNVASIICDQEQKIEYSLPWLGQQTL